MTFSDPSIRRTTLTVLLTAAVMLVATGLYWPALHGEYVWDDIFVITLNPRLKADLGWSAVSGTIIEGATYFRPLVMATFAIERKIWGLNATPAHAVSLLIYGLNILMTLALARRLFLRLQLRNAGIRAVLAAFLYAIHPSLVESTVWLSGRFDLLVTTLCLTALWTETFEFPKLYRAALLSTLFFLALLCKESAACLPAALLLLRLSYDKQGAEGLLSAAIRILKADWYSVAALAVAFSAYLVLRFDSLGSAVMVSDVADGLGVFGRINLVLFTLATYGRQALAPFAFVSPIQPLDPSIIFSISGILISASTLALLIALISQAKKHNPAALLLLTGGAFLLPVLNIIPLLVADNLIQDRFLTLPLSLATIALASASVPRVPWLRVHLIRALLVLVFATWTGLSMSYVRVTVPLWHSNLSMWSWLHQRNPDSSAARRNYVAACLARRRYDLAKPIFEDLVKKGPMDFRDQLQYATYLISIDEREEGKNYLLGVLDNIEKYHEMPDNLGRTLLAKNAMSSRLSVAYANLSDIETHEHHFESALTNIRIAEWYWPEVPAYLISESNILLALGAINESIDKFEAGVAGQNAEDVAEFTRMRGRFIKALCSSETSEQYLVCANNSIRAQVERP